MIDGEDHAQPTLGFIGTGKVGTTLARLYSQQGYVVSVWSSRQPDAIQEAVRSCDLCVICVPDDVIQSIADMIASQASDLTGKAIVHTSGAHDAHVLDALAAKGAAVGSFHPAYPFANVESALNGLIGASFAIEAQDARLNAWLCDLALALNGQIIQLTANQKALYHAALCIASNYAVTLYALAEHLLLGMNTPRAAVDQALGRLMAGTVDNLREKGIPDALTGPLVRGDINTVQAHITALNNVDEEIAHLYRLLGRATLPLVQARGVPIEAIEKLFGKDDHHAADST